MVVYLSVALIYALLCFSYIGFWNAMDPEPHLGVFDDECKSQMRLPSKYVKVTQDVVNWLVYEDLGKKKRRQEVWDCLLGTKPFP